MTHQRTTTVIALSVMILCAAPVRAPAQVTLQIGGGAGLATPTGDYGGTTLEYYAGTAYGLSNGLDLFLKGRIGLLGLGLAGELDYSSYSNAGNSEVGKGTITVEQHVLALRFGPEFSIGVPLAPVSGYLGGNLALNAISGQSTFLGVADVPSGTLAIPTAGRFGVGVNGGVLFRLGLLTTLDLGAAYNVLNVSGRGWENTGPMNDARVNSYAALNDVGDPNYAPGSDKHFIATARSIQTFELRAALMFGL